MSQLLLQNPLGCFKARVPCAPSSKVVKQASNRMRPCHSGSHAFLVRAGSFNGRPFSRSASANEDILEDIFRGVVGTLFEEFSPSVQKPGDMLQLAVDEYEEDDYYLWCADLPGVKRENLKVQIKDGFLIISGKRELNTSNADNPGGRRVRRAERQRGKFFRKVQLPADADHDSRSICAKVSDGVLEVTVFKLPSIHADVDVDF